MSLVSCWSVVEESLVLGLFGPFFLLKKKKKKKREKFFVFRNFKKKKKKNKQSSAAGRHCMVQSSPASTRPDPQACGSP